MKRANPAKLHFIGQFPDKLIEHDSDKLKDNIKFSFQYFDNSQEAGQDFNQWTKEQLEKLLNKLKHYSSNTISHWKNQRVGSGGLKILEIYKKFPTKSDFVHPKHIPLDVSWARFRMESDMRLIGFLVPPDIAVHSNLNPNIFYIVFLDQYHKFYQSEEK